MMTSEMEAVWDELVERELFTSKELRLVCDMCGVTIETLNFALYCRYGYRSLEQLHEEEEEDS